MSARLSDIETIALSHMTYLNDEIRESYVKELMAHLNSEDIRIPTEFVVSKRALKEVKNLTYKGDDLVSVLKRHFLARQLTMMFGTMKKVGGFHLLIYLQK